MFPTGNSHVLVLNRKTLQVLYQFGSRGTKSGDFQGPHHLAVDSKGNLYTAEVNPGKCPVEILAQRPVVHAPAERHLSVGSHGNDGNVLTRLPGSPTLAAFVHVVG